MMGNFDFLKSVNIDLYELAQEAEKLFRDEYFEQCVTQTRRFAENLCRLVIDERAKPGDSFDEMLATLKDTPNPSEFEKEFLDDLYFLKKAGNASVHSLKVKKDGKEALECLERSFEAAINFAVFKAGEDKKVLNLAFDEELLMTGKKSKKSGLRERYVEELKKTQCKSKITKKKTKKNDFSAEEYLRQKDNAKPKKLNTKKLFKEIRETLLAIIIIYIVYLLIFNK